MPEPAPLHYTLAKIHPEFVYELRNAGTRSSIYVHTDNVALNDGTSVTAIVTQASPGSPLQPNMQVRLKRTGKKIEVTYMANVTRE